MENELDMLEASSKKMERFCDAVNCEIESKVNCIIDEAEKSKGELLNQANDEALQLAYDRIKENVKQISAKYFKIVAKAELDSKKEVLKYREQLIVNLFNTVEEKISEFRNTDAYEEFLKNHLKACEVKAGAVIFLNPCDMKYSKALSKLIPNGCEIKEDSSFKSGGFSVFYPDENIMIDKTIDSAIKEARAEFNCKNCFSLN